MTDKKNTRIALKAWLAKIFPEREFFMRSQGQMRFLTVTTRMQVAAASVALVAATGYVGSLGYVAVERMLEANDRAELAQREAEIETAESRVARYREDLDAVTRDLERRQDFLDAMVEILPPEMRDAAAEQSESESTADETVAEVSRSIPEATALARIEARQLAFVEQVTRYAESRAQRAASSIRRLGLNPAEMVDDAETAMGGPLERLGAGLDPRFERMGLSLARMRALEDGLRRVPQVQPAHVDISSRFGFRRDPFTGGGAMHSGLDFRGPVGAPIHAAAAGRVVFAGRRGGYGNVVEIDHGNGLMTRYAHMSRIGARVGDTVGAGASIGAIGSTGRSTGPHLHFEVRINGRAVDPMPFLEARGDVRQAGRSDG